jgi:hypothetical protein
MAEEHLQWQAVDWMMTVRFEDMKNSFEEKVDALFRYDQPRRECGTLLLLLSCSSHCKRLRTHFHTQAWAIYPDMAWAARRQDSAHTLPCVELG